MERMRWRTDLIVFELSTTNAFINFSLTNLSTDEARSSDSPDWGPYETPARTAADATQADGF
jgi:hypothetical protein